MRSMASTGSPVPSSVALKNARHVLCEPTASAASWHFASAPLRPPRLPPSPSAPPHCLIRSRLITKKLKESLTVKSVESNEPSPLPASVLEMVLEQIPDERQVS